jgi:transposase
MKDDLKALWSYRHAGCAERFWSSGTAAPCTAAFQGVSPSTSKPTCPAFCRTAAGRSDQPCRGNNNKIKVIKRMAYSYRDDAYFLLKIRAAFPGNRR